jgi:hypothetical protein
MATVRNADAKRAVIREWDRWVKDHPDAPGDRMGGLGFFTYLQKEKSELLDFRAAGDKWQVVHGWLLREGRVKH